MRVLTETSFTDLIRAFLAESLKRGKGALPRFGSAPWHLLLYELKRSCGWDCIGEFDWDGPWPESRNLADMRVSIYFFCSLRVDGRLLPDPDLVLWEATPELKQRAGRMIEIAGTFAGFFEPRAA